MNPQCPDPGAGWTCPDCHGTGYRQSATGRMKYPCKNPVHATPAAEVDIYAIKCDCDHPWSDHRMKPPNGCTKCKCDQYHIPPATAQPEPTAESADILLNQYYWGKDWPGEYPDWNSPQVGDEQRAELLELQALLVTARREGAEQFAEKLKAKCYEWGATSDSDAIEFAAEDFDRLKGDTPDEA